MTRNPLVSLAGAAKVAALTVVLMILQAAGSWFIPAAQEPGAQPPQPSGVFLATVVGVLLLQTVALAYPASRSRWHGWRLAGAIFVLYFGTVTFLSQVESLVYLGGHMPPGMLSGIFLMGLFTATVFSPVLVLALGRWTAGDQGGARIERPRATWALRLLLGAAVFASLYYLFGYYVAWKNPVLRDYYGGTDPGSFLAQMSATIRDAPWMLPLQFARGLIWTLLAMLGIRMMAARWWQAGVALSMLFTVPTLYLLFPNPVMPEAVRLTHILETAPYQFLFGWFAAWLFTRGPALDRLPREGQATSS